MDWLETLLEKKRVVLVLLFILVLGIVTFLFFQKKQADETQATSEAYLKSITKMSTVESSSDISETDIYVDIKGQVKMPGMYKISEGSRLIEAINIAGGFTADADQNQLNFALKLADQEVVYVPKIGEVTNEAAGSITAGQTGEEEKSKVNINTADTAELQTLSGIGEKKAQDIIAYREANGSFKNINELTNVSGIGEKTVEKIKDYITI